MSESLDGNTQDGKGAGSAASPKKSRSKSKQPQTFGPKAHCPSDTIGKGKDTNPGAGSYNPIHSFGSKSTDFGKNKGGAFFGSSARPWQKKRNPDVESPRPGTNGTLRSSLANQAESTSPSASRCVFGKSHRNDSSKMYLSNAHAKKNINAPNPGPGTYEAPSSLSAQADSNKGSSATSKIGTQTRFKNKVLQTKDMTEGQPQGWTPGPGSYTLTSSMGKQIASGKESSAKADFGTAPSDQYLKTYISRGHSDNFMGNNSPGPIYKPNSEGRQKSTGSYEKNGTFGFGDRMRTQPNEKEKMGVPGPGSYSGNNSLGRQMRGKTAPQYGFGTSSRAHRNVTAIS